jgi:hypothetical protein
MGKPARVKESPVQMECKVREVVELGDEGGSGNLIICEILMIHIDDNILDEEGNIDTRKIDLVGRMGGNYYVHANGDALFEVPKPIRQKGMGVDQLPENIRNSNILTGNDLGMLGNVERMPTKEEALEFSKSNQVAEEWDGKQKQAHDLLCEAKIDEAWKVLLS